MEGVVYLLKTYAPLLQSHLRNMNTVSYKLLQPLQPITSCYKDPSISIFNEIKLILGHLSTLCGDTLYI